jgi:hypothetical protein
MHAPRHIHHLQQRHVIFTVIAAVLQAGSAPLPVAMATAISAIN